MACRPSSSSKPTVGSLATGTYLFTLAVAKDSRTATASVTIYVLAGRWVQHT